MPRAIRPRPPLLRALGAGEPPRDIEVDGVEFEWVETFKHDSWAATALYASRERQIVCKFNRSHPILFLPTLWLGRRLARREARALTRLADVRGIPPCCGPVRVDGNILPNAVAHAYIAGHPLGSREELNDDFFPELVTMVHAVHQRDMAYVDLHKRENIVVGTDNRPYLVDFQVCFGLWNPRLSKNVVLRAILKALQQSDLYHLAKHIARHRPDQLQALLPADETARPLWIKAHRKIAAPLRTLRRSLLAAIGVRGRGGRATTEGFAEDAVRRELAMKQAA
jgi:hypothetical protein